MTDEVTEGASASPSLTEVVSAAIETWAGGKFKCRPGKVTKYDAANQVADVAVLLKRQLATADGTALVESIGVIPSVPVQFPRVRQFFISFPLESGDYVLLQGVDQSIDAFMASQDGTEVSPEDFRLWDTKDAVAFPCFWPDFGALGDASSNNMVLGKDGGVQIHITGDNKVEVKASGGSASQSAAIAEKLQTLYASLKTIFDTHIHPTPAGPASPTATPAPAWDSTIASTKLKLED